MSAYGAARASGVRIGADALRAFVVALFETRGMRTPDAQAVATNLVWADLRGVGSHGVSRVERYFRMIEDGDLDPRATPVIEAKGPSLVLVRAGRAAGAVTMTATLAEAERRSKQQGCCICLIAQTTHTGAIGQYAGRLAQRGLATLLMGAGSPMMAYHGARIPSLSTSPIALGVPAPGRPLVIDMATAVAAIGRLRASKNDAAPLPEGMALDLQGVPTTDPARAATVLPIGGAKGSGLSLLIECLTSLMASAPILTLTVGPAGDGRHRHNALLIAIDVATLHGDLAAYTAEVGRLQALVKSLEPRPGFEELLLPGERGERVAEQRRREGIPLSASTWNSLVSVASAAGVALPETQ